MTALPAVWPEIWIACRIGTPEETVPEKVRDQRASATFWTTSPTFAGMRSLKRSQARRPRSVFFQRTKTYASDGKRRDQDVPGARDGVRDPDGDLGHATAGRSSSPFSDEISLKMPTKTGTTKATITTITMQRDA